MSRTSWKLSWNFFISYSVSMTCKLIPLPSSCLLASIIVQLEILLNSLYFHTAESAASIITFWVEYTHMCQMIIYLNCNLSTVVLAMTEKLNRCSIENVNSYLFQSLSVKAEYLIVQQTATVWICILLPWWNNKLSLYAEIVFCLFYVSL